MRTIDQILEELIYAANHPAEMMKKYKKETGKGAIGIMPVYSPEEIVHAAGYLPIGIWGGQTQISKARAVLPPFACSIMQTFTEMQFNHVYDDLEAIIFSVPCDTLKCVSQKWKGNCPSIVFTHPQNRKIKAAVPFMQRELEIVKEKLEKILNIEISDAAIANSIQVYNENRKVMREFTEIAGLYPQVITASKRHAVIKARWFMEKSAHTVLVKELIDALKQEQPKENMGKKVVVTGIMLEPYALTDIFDENELIIVADDLAQESRQFRNDVPEHENPLTALSMWWQNFDGCALATDPSKPRGSMLVDLVKKYQADAVIVCMMKFCDPEEFDYPIYIQELEEAEIRSLMIEIDQETTSFEQVKTRIQTFSEIL